jgi:hypothetical protein
MNFVCKQLDESLNPPVCTEWSELEPTTNLLPPITKQEADALLIAIIPCFVIVFVVRRILSMLR